MNDQKPKVLVITYYWPPAGGPGVQRWLKFVKYLPDFGVEPVVYVPENPSYPVVDSSFEKEVPPGMEVLKHPVFEPYAFASWFSGRKKTREISSGVIADKKQSFAEKLMLWVRGNFFIPDARVFWVKPSVRFLKSYLEKENIRVIITTGPPHSLHLIGMRLKKQCGVHWIADFRDPWTTIGYHRKLKLSHYARKRHEALEKEVLHTADRVVATSFTTADEFREKSGRAVEVITNGYDPTYTGAVVPDETFTIAHIGSLLTERNPVMLWEALAELASEHKDLAANLVLKLAGTVSPEVTDTIRRCGLEPYVRPEGYVSHEEALRLQRAASVLLLIEIDRPETRAIIPGKLFEYLDARRPVIAIGPEGWDVTRIMEETGMGPTYTYGQKEMVKTRIFRCYERFLRHKHAMTPSGLQKYSRRSLANRMANLVLEFSEKHAV
ncbi:glycosyltransferase [Sinomicrobium soli]|uniref:glycosyltransferase n=1 Tax=Sinomicrobium sp. N-1-3-6 TaxID=2219864 RepID=UPI001F1F65D3|nr:glycosyltransferase [Sinomicrobium sp. N-1-3-6]